jgi:amino acid adenylation domain-containing protein
MFVLQNTTSPFSGIPGLRVEPIELETTRSPFDLSLFLREREGKYIGYIEYSTDLFDRDRIERMAGHFQILLDAIVAHPDQLIARLPILTDAERYQILVEWNDTVADYPKDNCIHHLFEEQVERTPGSIAVEFEEKRVTYRELNQRANQLAQYLTNLGIGPEKLVGICVERSIEMVVGLLGILKAGGAYVPLDPSYPKERLRFMIEDANISLLVTQQNLLDRTQDSALSTQHVDVYLDRDWPKIEQQSSENPTTQIQSHNLAYVIYTSGSAGRPKGVQIEHRSVVNCLCSIGREIDLSARDAWLAVTTISFDIAALELFLPLITGAKLVLASKSESGDGAHLLARLKASQANVIQATPSLWKLLLDSGWERGHNLKILCGGEALSRQLADQLLDRSTAVWNLYGPTETTIWSTMQRVEPSDDPVLIGRPIANTEIYILDCYLQPVPSGVHGDLYIGGAGLARRYLNREDLTAESFLRNPFSDDPDARLYRTGDRARYRPTGNIEFLGRSDHQVKIRGHRIELGEIETILDRHPAVKESVILARDRDSSGEKELTGFVVSDQEAPLSVSELRRFLLEILPDYMIPSSFVFLDSFSLTPNGKIDRNALPSPDEARPQLNQNFVEPRTEIEELVAQGWREVLKLDKIGIHDNFFELGGHSLLATRVIARVRDAFNRDIPLREFFEAPTVAGLAMNVQALIVGNLGLTLPPIVRVPRGGVFPLSQSQRQLWTLDQLLPGTRFLTMPYALRLIGVVNVEALRKSLQEIVRRHEVFQMVFKELKGRPVQFVGPVPNIELPVVDLRHFPPQDIDKEFVRISTDDASLPFDLEEGHPFRIQLVRLADNEHVLLITVHHIVCDQWSMQVFRRELMVLYEECSQGRPPSLSEVPIQFIDFVCWQRDLLKRGLFKPQLSYWEKQLVGPAPKLEFQKNPKNKQSLSLLTSTQTIEVSQTTLMKLKALANGENSTLFMVLLSVLKIVLYLHTRQTDIRVGTTVANRSRREADEVIGYCLNAVILRTQLSPHMTFKQLLKQVREIVLGAMGNQELPFGQVARMLTKDKAAKNDTPPFQVMFIYQNHTSQSKEVSGLTFASWDGRLRRAHPDVALTTLDLIFDLREASTKLTGTVNYKTDVVDDVVSEMIEAFYEVTKRVVCQPSRYISDVLNDMRAKGAVELSRSLRGESPV